MTTVKLITSDLDDLKWMKEVHKVPEDTKFAVLYGSEDSPTKIECWFVSDPAFDDIPDHIIIPPRVLT